MDKILVTGNNGSVGRTLTRLFDQKNIKWVGSDGYDLTEKMDAKALFVKNPDISQVIHLASVQNSDPAVFSKNTRMVENLLEFMQSDLVKRRLLFLSSNTVYGNLSYINRKYNQDRLNKISEEVLEIDITIPTSNYGASKLACENLIKVATLQNQIESVILRSSAIVGPETRFGAFKDLYEKLKNNNGEIEAFGWTGGSTKQYLHVDDLCSFIIYILRNSKSFNDNIFNVTTRGQSSIGDMITIINSLLNPDQKVEIKWNCKTSPTDNELLLMNTDKLKNITNWQPHCTTSNMAIMAATQDKIMLENL